MDCQYCGKIFSSDYNLRRHEDEYCPNRDNDADEASDESMETHASRDDNTSEHEESDSESSSENSSEEEIDPWSTLIEDAASKVRAQYEEILQTLLMEGHDENEAKQEAFAQILPVFQKELGDVYMDDLAWMKTLKKDPIHKKIMATRDDYVNNNMFDLDEALAAAVKKRKFLVKRLSEHQGRFAEQ